MEREGGGKSLLRFWGSSHDKFGDPLGDRQMAPSTLTEVVIHIYSHSAASY